ncbi:hypothetical protein OF83DRAFT_1086368 [Amylostereum chailletii]|nr:hypothetical protein OF83DRAFT_1086368 [Amylostereum chailletii]
MGSDIQVDYRSKPDQADIARADIQWSRADQVNTVYVDIQKASVFVTISASQELIRPTLYARTYRRSAFFITGVLIIIQRKVIFTTKLPAGRMLPYGRELKKVMGHPAVEDALSALEREVAESYCADAKHGSQLAEEDVILAAQRLTEIVGDNLLHEE